MTNGPAQILVLHLRSPDPCLRETAAAPHAGAMRRSIHPCPSQALPLVSASRYFQFCLGIFSSFLSFSPQSHLSLTPLHPKIATCSTQNFTPFCPTAASLLPNLCSCLSPFVRVWDTTVEKGLYISAILYLSRSEHTYLFTFLLDSFPNMQRPGDNADCLS